MHLTLPKFGLVEKIYPSDANATGQLTGTSGSYSAYGQIVASTSADFVLQGIALSCVFSVGASVDQDILLQVQIATGGAGAESIIEQVGKGFNLRYDHVVGALARLSSSQLLSFVPKLIPSGTRLSVRSTTLGTQGATIGVYLVGYEPSAGYALPSPRREMQHFIERYIKGHKHSLSTCFPDAATTNVTTDATTTWVAGSWVEFSSAVPRDVFVTGLVNGIRTTSPLSRHAVVEIGTGAGGSEVARARVPLPGITSQNTPIPGFKKLIRPLYVPTGQRLAARVKGSVQSMAIPIFLTADEVL